jgi:hypothetical protein
MRSQVQNRPITNTEAMRLRGKIALCVLSLLLAPDVAHAQETQRTLTIADCPPGYVLGVQDTAEPQPLTKATPSQADATTYTVDGAMAAYKAQQETDIAPRAFVTGCIKTTGPSRP